MRKLQFEMVFETKPSQIYYAGVFTRKHQGTLVEVEEKVQFYTLPFFCTMAAVCAIIFSVVCSISNIPIFLRLLMPQKCLFLLV